jgi:hypothetical protein
MAANAAGSSSTQLDYGIPNLFFRFKHALISFTFNTIGHFSSKAPCLSNVRTIPTLMVSSVLSSNSRSTFF